ncbi:MAG: ATPase domain-containing protein [Actinomycetota bacterium]
MAKVRSSLACTSCGQPSSQWAGKCAGCGAWGTIEEASPRVAGKTRAGPSALAIGGIDERGIPTGFAGFDRVLGGGLVPGSVVLLSGEPGIGKSTLLLQLVSALSSAGLPCLLASGEESHGQVAGRAARLGVGSARVSFMNGRDLASVVEATMDLRPALLAVDSIQTMRGPEATGIPGGTAQVRACADALVGLAKESGVSVLMTGHVTKDGDLAGPRTLEHAVDVVLAFDGDPRSGRRVLAGGKNRFGREGEVAWFEMASDGLHEVDAAELAGESGPGSAVALPLAGRRALAVEVQALAVPTEGPSKRQVTGLDPRRFQLIAAVVDRTLGIPLARSELYGAVSGGIRVDDPGSDLAVAAALASAATGAAVPSGCAFAGEVGLTGTLRSPPGMAQRISAAETAGIVAVVAPSGEGSGGTRVVQVGHLMEALSFARSRGASKASSTRHRPDQRGLRRTPENAR